MTTDPVSIVVTKKVLEKVLDDLYRLVKEKAGRALARLVQKSNIETICKKLDSIQRVKTIWQIDKDVKLTTFYYPSRVEIDRKSYRIDSVEELTPNSENVVIQGTVGQGKSIFLRYLCIREAARGNRLPVFLELRQVEKAGTIQTHVSAVLRDLGFDVDDALFELYASSGKFLFLLDGFDELDEEMVPTIVKELDGLSQRFPLLQMIVTSRPDSGIEGSTRFRVCRLEPLKPADHGPFLEKIISDEKRAKEILTAIKASPAEVKGLLTTPLMLTLLVIVYKAESDIPSALSEFYDVLFQTLVTRHDKTKPGFRRKRHSKLGDGDLRRLFEGFCFVAKLKGLKVLKSTEFADCLEIASKTTGIVCDGDGFIDDITKIACLMQEEGSRYHFIHRSVSEFYVASFVSRSSAEFSSQFYRRLREGGWQTWRQELVFLAQMDTFRYLKEFLIPDLRMTIEELTTPGGTGGDTDINVMKGLAVVETAPPAPQVTVEELVMIGWMDAVDVGWSKERAVGEFLGELSKAMSGKLPKTIVTTWPGGSLTWHSGSGRSTTVPWLVAAWSLPSIRTANLFRTAQPLGRWLKEKGLLGEARAAWGHTEDALKRRLREAEEFVAREAGRVELLSMLDDKQTTAGARSGGRSA